MWQCLGALETREDWMRGDQHYWSAMNDDSDSAKSSIALQPRSKSMIDYLRKRLPGRSGVATSATQVPDSCLNHRG